MSTDNGTSTSYYLFNAHGDVTGLTKGAQTVTKSYDYDAFGNEKEPSATDTNPFRYCGEYFDKETGTYYLRAIYYDPSIGRFTQQDTHWNTVNMIYGDNPNKINEREDALGLKQYTYAPSISSIMQSGNLYVYCINNPILFNDYTGRVSHIVVGALVGLVAGVAAQVITDVATSLINRKASFSNWQTYAGAAIGGTVGGAVLAATGNPMLAGATTGFVGTFSGQTIEKWTGENNESFIEILAVSFENGAISGAFSMIPTMKIPKFTAGRNSFSAVYKSGMTKLRHNVVSRMSAKVMGKGLAVDVFNGVPSNIWFGYMESDYYKKDTNTTTQSCPVRPITTFYNTLY